MWTPEGWTKNVHGTEVSTLVKLVMWTGLWAVYMYVNPESWESKQIPT